MPDTLILVPIASLTLPGILAFGLGLWFRSIWPALVLVLAALGSALFFLSQATGASWNDSSALNNLFAAFGISLPALISAAVGGVFARRRGAG